MSESPTAVVAAEPKTIVIERRWAIIGGAAVAALIIGLGVALAFTAGEADGPDGPPGAYFQMRGGEGGYGGPPGFAPGGAPPQGAPLPGGAPQAPGGYPPGGGTYPAPPQGVPAPPSGQGSGGSGSNGGGSGQGSNR